MTDKERCRAIIRPGPNFWRLPPGLLDKHTTQHSLCRLELNNTLSFQNAVGVVVENWTNQRLEFPEVEVEAGGQDRWYQPAAVPPHTRDLALLAHSTRGDLAQVLLVNSSQQTREHTTLRVVYNCCCYELQGCVCWLVEDSWPRLYLCLAWRAGEGVVRAAAALTDSRQQYSSLAQEGTTLMKVATRSSCCPNYSVI